MLYHSRSLQPLSLMASPLLLGDWQIERVKKFGNLLIYTRIPHGFIMDPTYQ